MRDVDFRSRSHPIERLMLACLSVVLALQTIGSGSLKREAFFYAGLLPPAMARKNAFRFTRCKGIVAVAVLVRLGGSGRWKAPGPSSWARPLKSRTANRERVFSDAFSSFFPRNSSTDQAKKILFCWGPKFQPIFGGVKGGSMFFVSQEGFSF